MTKLGSGITRTRCQGQKTNRRHNNRQRIQPINLTRSQSTGNQGRNETKNTMTILVKPTVETYGDHQALAPHYQPTRRKSWLSRFSRGGSTSRFSHVYLITTSRKRGQDGTRTTQISGFQAPSCERGCWNRNSSTLRACHVLSCI